MSVNHPIFERNWHSASDAEYAPLSLATPPSPLSSIGLERWDTRGPELGIALWEWLSSLLLNGSLKVPRAARSDCFNRSVPCSTLPPLWPDRSFAEHSFRAELARGDPLNLSILVRGGEGTNKDSLSNGE
jgi:hypothetical protein